MKRKKTITSNILLVFWIFCSQSVLAQAKVTITTDDRYAYIGTTGIAACKESAMTNSDSELVAISGNSVNLGSTIALIIQSIDFYFYFYFFSVLKVLELKLLSKLIHTANG